MSEASKSCSSTSTTSTRPSPTSDYVIFQKHTWHIDWEWSHIYRRHHSHAHRRQRQPGLAPQVGTSYFQKQTWHMFCIDFFKKSIGNGLKYVRGLKVMLIDADNVNKAESHYWVCHIFKNTHDICFIPKGVFDFRSFLALFRLPAKCPKNHPIFLKFLQ